MLYNLATREDLSKAQKKLQKTKWYDNLLTEDFKKLNNVGIFFDSPIEAAKQINKIWDNIYGWWKNQSLQDVRNEFCLKYSYVHPHNMRNFGNQLKKFLD